MNRKYEYRIVSVDRKFGSDVMVTSMRVARAWKVLLDDLWPMDAPHEIHRRGRASHTHPHEQVWKVGRANGTDWTEVRPAVKYGPDKALEFPRSTFPIQNAEPSDALDEWLEGEADG